MSTIVTRAGKGSPLTWNEVDNNFTNLNTDKYQSGSNVSLGTIAGTTITSSALTSSRIPFASTGGLLADDSRLTWDSTALYTPNVILPQSAWTVGCASSTVDIVGYGSTGSGGTTNTLVFNTNASERMRINSSGYVGIGTATPDAMLTITKNQADSINIRNANTNYSRLGIGIDTVAGITYLSSSSSGSGSFIPLAFYTSDLERMRIDTAGNLGLGVTPSVWSVGKAIEIGNVGNGIWGVANSSTIILNNAYYNSSYKYARAGSSSYYQQNDGLHYWFIAPAGTAGNNITFTQAMTLNASGNLGLGVTPSAWTGTGAKAIQVGSYTSLISANGITDVGHNIYGNYSYLNTAPASFYRQIGGMHQWFNSPSGTAGTAISTYNQYMTLDTSGNLLVGTTSNAFSSRLCVQGTAGISTPDVTVGIPVNSSGNTCFTIARSAATTGYIQLEAIHAGITGANIVVNATNGGNLLVGTSANPSSAQAGMRLGPSGFIEISRGSGTTSWNQITFINGNGTVGTITTNGTATSYVTSSDYRLKENIAPMVGALDTVAALKPVTYKWKADGSDGQGFIAHELAEVVPDCVTGEKDATREEEYEISPAIPAVLDEEGNEVTPAVEAVMGTRTVPVYQGIDTSFLVATLTAAIQEQQAMIDELKAKVAALEAA